MTDADEITSLQELLAAHRRTLAILLRQVATHTQAYAPPVQISGIADDRAAILRLKTALRAAGEEVEDQEGDEATPGEADGPAGALVIAAPHAARDVNIATNQTIVNVSHHHPQPRPAIDPAQAQQLLDRLPLDTIPDPAPLPSGSRMQLRRNPLFVGREADLKAIAQALKGGGVAAITTGIGGVGKTQLASEFAHRYGQFFTGGVFWLSFADPAGIDSEIAACGGAGALELYRDADGLSQAEQVAKVYAEWERDIPRLLIFDNCDDLPGKTAEQQLAERLPNGGGCRVLVTSRRGQWRTGLGIAALPLGMLDRAESVALLRGYRADVSDAGADAIAAELGDLPLALMLAGSYLETYRDEVFGAPTAYLANLRRQLLDHRSLSAQERSVRATFDLSYQRLDAADSVDALAIAALARAAHLAPGEPFPRTLLLATLGDDTDDEEIAAQRADALRRLVALGLLEVAAVGALRIHRLVAAFAREAIKDDKAQVVVEWTLAKVVNGIVNDEIPTRLLPMLAHLRHTMTIADRRGGALAGELANALGRTEQALTNYAARPLYERALVIREQALGPQHPDTATSLNNLALLLYGQGDYAAARPLYERALAICEHSLGVDHSTTRTIRANLAALDTPSTSPRRPRPSSRRRSPT